MTKPFKKYYSFNILESRNQKTILYLGEAQSQVLDLSLQSLGKVNLHLDYFEKSGSILPFPL